MSWDELHAEKVTTLRDAGAHVDASVIGVRRGRFVQSPGGFRIREQRGGRALQARQRRFELLGSLAEVEVGRRLDDPAELIDCGAHGVGLISELGLR